MMRKYSKEDNDRANSELRLYLSEGLTYHQAAKKVAEKSPISIISLRHKAYQIAVSEGYFSGHGRQHKELTTHGLLLTKCQEKLKSNGYTIIVEQNEIRKFMESRGSKGNPDLIGMRGSEILLVEILERVKHLGTFIDQLERYAKIGKLAIVLPIDTTNIQVWGRQELS
jgi:hypothetical protein